MLKKKKKSPKNKDGEFEDEEDEVMMAQMAAKGAGTLQFTKPPSEPLIEIEAKPDPQDSEEWQKFNAMLNKSQETVTMTQTKMSKLADTSTTSANKTASSSTAAAATSWASFEPEAEQLKPSSESKPPEEAEPPSTVAEANKDSEEKSHIVPNETATADNQQTSESTTAPAVDSILKAATPDSSINIPQCFLESARTPIDNTVMASSTTSTGTVVALEPQTTTSPISSFQPSSAIARPRPKASEITLSTPTAPASVPSPSAYAVPDMFDTSKFLDDSGKGSDNPFKVMMEDSDSKHVDLDAEDFFSKISANRATTSEAWGNLTSGSSLLVPGKGFDAIQSYTDDEALVTEGGHIEGGFSSANNPFRSSSPAVGASGFGGGEEDLFAQLANMGNSSTKGAAGSEWDEFDPFCEHSKPAQQSSEQSSSGGAFAVNFDEASSATQKRSQMEKERQSSQQSSGSGGSVNEYDDDTVDTATEPLAPFHEPYRGQFFQMGLRQPPKKSKMPFSGQRGWRTTYARIENDPKNQNVYMRLYLSDKDAAFGKNPLTELKLDPYMTLSEIGMQPFDEYGKVYTTKVYRTDYKERPSLRVDKITPKGLTLTSIKDLKRLITKPKTTMILDHAPQHDELMKMGSLNYEELKQFRWCFEDAMMRVITKRQQTSQQYTKDEIIAEIIDEYEASVDKWGHITEQKARVRIYCLSFLSGMAFVEFGVNDIRRKGKEVVRRQDIIPMRTEHWIRIEDYQFHCCVNIEEFNKSTVIRFQPPDGINVEILRFRVRPRKNFQLPLQVRAIMNVDKTNRDVEIRMEVLIPGYFSNSRKANQAPCENIAIAFPIPEPWIYYFRVEHVWGYGSVHAHKARPGKVKGLDRITNMAEGLIPKGSNPNGCQMEVNTGDCKYEHLLNGLVWRIPRLPERFQGAYKTHLMSVKIPLGPHDPIPENYEKFVTVDYTMPATSVSRAMIRSVSSTSQADEPPDKWVKQLARYYYKVEVEYSFEVRAKGDTVEKLQSLELPATLAAGEKIALSAQPSANPEETPVDARLAASDPDSSDEDGAKVKKPPVPVSAAPSSNAQPQEESIKPTGLKVSDESDSSDEDEEDERPKFKIQLNPVIQSFIDKGGAMMNGAMKKKAAEQEPQKPPPPPHPSHQPDTGKRPQSPGTDGGSELDSEDEKKAAHHPKRPPPPRPAPPPPGGPPSASSGGKKWTVIAEAEAPPKTESEA